MIKLLESKSSVYTTRVTEARPTTQSLLMGTMTPTSLFFHQSEPAAFSTYLSLTCLLLKEGVTAVQN